jgi:hypothetical protein
VTGLREMRKPIFLNVLVIFLIGVLITQTHAENLDRVESVEDIEHVLAYQDSGGIFDFGNYLKGGGIKELNELCQSFNEEGFRLWLITIPKSMPVNVAERIYGNMNYDEKDILIVFKPRRLYGKTLALKGEPEKFKEYVQKSRKAFKRYIAYGLEHYALLIKNRILERREESIRAKSRRGSIVRTVSIFLGLAVVGGIIYVFVLMPRRRKKIYQQQIEKSSTLLGEISMMDIPEKFENSFLELSSKLDGYRKSENYGATKRIEEIMDDMKKLKTRIKEGEG